MENSKEKPKITTLGALKQSGYRPLSVKQEIAKNTAEKLKHRQAIFTGLFGYDDTVVPQLLNALLAGHDLILLGERGQAKTRIARSIADLLDEWVPIIEGSEINEDPLKPLLKKSKEIIKQMGDETPIDWVNKKDRLNEKLATPDTVVSDLIGDVDPIKVAEGRYLSDESVINFGLIPRSNRGIFIINELPDLAERIQVGLFNILEERDIQIRNFVIRLPLDVFVIASANPEDYTNRGRIVTPLKDRFGAQVRTHYPQSIQTEAQIVLQEANIASLQIPGNENYLPKIEVPKFMLEIICSISSIARMSPQVNQRSGVSVRLSINNYETLVASAIKRALITNELSAVPRISDLDSLIDSIAAKIELDTFEEEGSEEVIASIIRAAVSTVYKNYISPDEVGAILGPFETGITVETGSDLSSLSYQEIVQQIPELKTLAHKLVDITDSAQLASAIEFILEGLHLSKRLNKDAIYGRFIFRSKQRPKQV